MPARPDSFARFAAVLLAAALLGVGCSQPRDTVAELSGQTMGTTFSIKLSPPPTDDVLARVQAEVTQRLEDINREMSTYRPDSTLSRFNRFAATDWYDTSPGIVALVQQAAGISAQTGGAYDVTVGPLVNLWGFGSDGRRSTPPSDAEIDALLPSVGYDKLHYRERPPALRKTVPGLQVDLSSIAKGWGVDEIARIIEDIGLRHYLVEIGGELRASGHKASGAPWRIAVERPVSGERSVQRVVALTDTAMATSGDYRNFFEQGGRRYSHTIDPVSGRSVRHRLAAVTVFADTCATADAWATALMALGDERAPAAAERAGIAALFIVREADGFREQASAALRGAGIVPDL
jgi:thiamine biosynthesis lipoprotein